MLRVNRNSAHTEIKKEDYIAIETIDNEVILYYNISEDIKSLIERLNEIGNEDVKLFNFAADDCARYSKKECDEAGGCCEWTTNGSMNYCKCIK